MINALVLVGALISLFLGINYTSFGIATFMKRGGSMTVNVLWWTISAILFGVFYYLTHSSCL